MKQTNKAVKLTGITNITYKNKFCSECKKELTNGDKYRKSRKLYRPFIEDCKNCEINAIISIANKL